MKKKANKIASLKLILAFALICIPQCIDASKQQSTQQYERTSENSNSWKNSNSLNSLASKNAPQSEEAALRKNPNRQSPKQGMKNDNFSNVDENYKRLIERDNLFSSENLKFDETEKKNFFDDGEMTGLLGSIENSVRKDKIDLSSVVTKDNSFHAKEISRNKVQDLGKEKERLSNKNHNVGEVKFKSNNLKNEKKKSRENVDSKRITGVKAESKGWKNSDEKIEVSKEQEEKPTKGKQSLSRKKLETTLSNEGRKKANENRIVYDSNFSSKKKMEEFGSGEDDLQASGDTDDDEDVDDEEDTSGERKGSGIGENNHIKGDNGSGEIEEEESGSGDKDEEGSAILESKQRFSQKFDRVKTIGQISLPVSKNFWNETLQDQPFSDRKEDEIEDNKEERGEGENEVERSGSGDEEGSTMSQSKHASSQITDQVKEIGETTPFESNDLRKGTQKNQALSFTSSAKQENDTKTLLQASIQKEMKTRTQNKGNFADSKIEVKIDTRKKNKDELEESNGDSGSASDVSKEEGVTENETKMENKGEIEPNDTETEGSGSFSDENSTDGSNKSSEEYSKYMKDWINDKNEESENNETDLDEHEANTQEKAEKVDMIDGSGQEEKKEIPNEISENLNENEYETDKENDQDKETMDESNETQNNSENNDQITKYEDGASGTDEVDGERKNNGATIKKEETPAFKKIRNTDIHRKEKKGSSRVVKINERIKGVEESGYNEEKKSRKNGSLGQFERQEIQQEENSGGQEDEFESGSSSGSGESESGYERNEIISKLQPASSENFETDEQHSGVQNMNEIIPLQGAWQTYSKLKDYGMERNEKGNENNHLYYKFSKKDSNIDSKQNKTMHEGFMATKEGEANEKMSFTNTHSSGVGMNRFKAPVVNGPKFIRNGGPEKHLMKSGENGKMFGDVDEFGEPFQRWHDKKETENEIQRNFSHDEHKAAINEEIKTTANDKPMQVSSANFVNKFKEIASPVEHGNEAVHQKMKMQATDKPMQPSSANPPNTMNRIKETVLPQENMSSDYAEQRPQNASQEIKSTPASNKIAEGANQSSAAPKESEETLEELNDEIVKEELKSKAMMKYLEKIDAELGEETNQGFSKISKQDKENNKGNLNLVNSSSASITENVVTNVLKNKTSKETERNNKKETSKQNETDGLSKNNLTNNIASFIAKNENVMEHKQIENLIFSKGNENRPLTSESTNLSKTSNGMSINKSNERNAKNNSSILKFGNDNKNGHKNNTVKNLLQNFTNVDQQGNEKKMASNTLISNGKNVGNTSKVKEETSEKDDEKLDDFVKGIFKGLEKTIEQKLETITMKDGTGNQNAAIRDKIEMKENKNEGSVVGTIVSGLTEKGLNKDVHLEEQAKRAEQNKQEKAKLNEKRKDVIVVNLHDEDEAIIKRDQSKRIADSRPGYKNDIILNYGKIYGGNSTLVADFSGGEEAAKLFIYPRKKDENAQKKDKVTRNEAAEKRSKMFCLLII